MKHASLSHPSSMLHICLYEIRLPPWTYRTLQPWEHLLSMEFVDVAPFCSPVTLSKTCFSLKLQLFPKNVQWEPGFTPKTRGRRRPTAGGGALAQFTPRGNPCPPLTGLAGEPRRAPTTSPQLRAGLPGSLPASLSTSLACLRPPAAASGCPKLPGPAAAPLAPGA